MSDSGRVSESVVASLKVLSGSVVFLDRNEIKRGREFEDGDPKVDMV